jgi:cobalt-zinc-cadmium efflux system membrane fusion protein
MTAKGTDLHAQPKRGLTLWRQIQILLGLAIAAAAGIAIVSGIDFAGTPAVSAAPQVPSEVTTFKPSPEELAGLVIKPVQTMAFRPETATEGSIGTDDNLTTPVFSPLSGRVTQLIVKPGDYVHKGQALVVVEASEIVQAQNDLIAAKSTLGSTRAQLDLARTNEQRQHALYDSQGAALRDWQQSQVDLATAEGNFHSAEIGLTAVRNRLRILGKSDEEIAALEDSPDMQRADPAATIRAPIEGTILQRQVGLGQYIQAASSTPLYLIGDLSTVWLIANVREADAPRVRIGDMLEVNVLAFPGRTFKARISYVAPSIDPNTHRLAVRADIDNHDGALKPQMFATFSIITGEESQSAAVPQSALLYDGEKPHVWVLGADGVLTLRDVRTGRTTGAMVEVVSGLSPGEKIVTSGTIFIDRAATGG